MLIRLTRDDKNACLIQRVGLAQVRQILLLCSRECYTAFQDVFEVLGGSV